MAVLAAGVCLEAGDVREIIDTDLTDAEINNFINAAHYRTRPLVGELGDCGGDDAVCEIVKFLAAHFITTRDRQTKSESVGGEWQVTYMGADGKGLDASLYGQQAKDMDCSGTLARAGLKRAWFSVTSYDDLEQLEPDTD
jgi:hypothetical protein